MKWLNLRSDTFTQPSAAMRASAMEVPLGNDVFGEDATVSALQKRCADELGFEAGLFVSSGTQSNLLALLAAHMNTHNIKFSASSSRIRLVLHLVIDDKGLARVIEAFRSF